MIEHGHATHPGLQRRHNEDTYWADTAHGLWLVADGMGGPGRGELASALALDAAIAAIHSGIGMADAFRRASAAIASHAAQHDTDAPMGSTLAALRIDGANDYQIAWIGDSPAYVWQDGCLAHTSRESDSTSTPADSGDPGAAPARRRVTQALGITPALEIDPLPVSGHCLPGMQFLLCSDGLSEELDDTRIAAIVARTDLAAQECVDQLVLAALDAGGHDNITVVLVRMR